MSDTVVGSAATLLAGNPSPSPAPAPAPSATPSGAAPTPAPAPTPSGAPTPSATTPWTDGFAADEMGFLEKKGFQKPADLLKSYRELERVLGHDKLVLPKDDAKPEEWDAVYARLGRPESPDKYTMPEGSDEGTFKALAPALHKAGLNQKQLGDITQAWNAHVENLTAADGDRYIKESDAAVKKLESEWGANGPKEIEISRRAARALGISEADADAYMRTGGTEKFMRLLNLAGRAVAEDNSGDIRNDSTLGFGYTPERAAAELAELRADKGFMERYQRKEPAAKQKFERLMHIMSDGGLVQRTVNTAPKRS